MALEKAWKTQNSGNFFSCFVATLKLLYSLKSHIYIVPELETR